MDNIFKRDINSNRGDHMQLITGEKLHDFVNEGKILQNAKIDNCEGIKYDLRISNMLLSGDFQNAVEIDELNYETREKLSVAPGEIVFLLTEEIICLPENMVATIVSKRKMNHEGVMVLGGSVVDPRYCGRLLFGLFNFSSEPFPILPGRKISSIMFYKLNDSETDDFPQPDARIDKFPDDLVKTIKKYKPTSNQSLLSEIKNMKDDLEKIKEKFDSNKKWFDDFKKNLGELKDSLSMEVATRQQSIDDLKQVFRDRDIEVNDRLNSKLLKYTATAAGISAMMVVLIGLVMYLFQNNILK